MNTTVVKFTCHTCGITEENVTVGAYDRKGVDVASWMRSVRMAVELHHRVLSPDCSSSEVDMMVPVDFDDLKSYMAGLASLPMRRATVFYDDETTE